MFVRYLAEQAHNVVKSERKPRRNIQYKDLGTFGIQSGRCSGITDTISKANAVSRIDNLEFLSDVIPRTQTYGQYMEKKNREYKETKSREAARNRAIENGQTTLDGSKPRHNGTHADVEIDDDEHTDEPMAGGDGGNPPAAIAHPSQRPRANGTLVFEHYEPNVSSRRDPSGDVEME